MKKILILYYTQTGQLKEIAQSFAAGFDTAKVSLDIVAIQPENDFPFPWTSDEFFRIMPDCVLLKGMKIKAPSFKFQTYDLVVLAYQPWFLSPSIPIAAALLHPQVQAVLKNTAVITLIGARNMWLNSQEKVKSLLKKMDAHLIGNIALVDRAPNLVSVLTVMRWMFQGKKEASKWLPASGVSARDIEKMKNLGTITQLHLLGNQLDHLQAKLIAEKALEVDTNLMFVEKRAEKLFALWANFIDKRSNKTLWARVYKWYLILALFVVAPVVLFIYSFFKPLLKKSIEKQQVYYLNVQ